MMDNTLEQGIRCKCGKFWGMRNHKKTCHKCKTIVIARGNKEKKWKTVSQNTLNTSY